MDFKRKCLDEDKILKLNSKSEATDKNTNKTDEEEDNMTEQESVLPCQGVGLINGPNVGVHNNNINNNR
jgi:hypothetical protein